MADPRDTNAATTPATAPGGLGSDPPPAGTSATPSTPASPPATPPASTPTTPPPASTPPSTPPAPPATTARVKTADGKVVEGTLMDTAPGGPLGRPVIPAAVNPDDLPPADGKIGGQDARGTITLTPGQPNTVPQPGGQGYINVNQTGPKLDDESAKKAGETIQPPPLKDEDLGKRQPEHTNIATTAKDVKEKKQASDAKVAE